MRGRAGRAAPLLLIAASIAIALVVFLYAQMGGIGGHQVGAQESVTARPGGPTAGPDALGLGGLAEVDSARADARSIGMRGATIRLAGPGQLVGTVLDRASGAGVSGCTVRLLPVPSVGVDVAAAATKLFGMGGDFTTRVQPVATAISDGRGRFAFRGIREGTWFMDAQSPYHILDAPVSARVLASGNGGPVDVWMRAGGRILGEVRGPDGAPVTGANVALTTGAMRFLEAMSTGEVAMLRAQTNSEGRFAFHGVAPGEGYELAAIGVGMSITHVLEITVTAGQDTEVLVQGSAGGTIRGRILSGWGEVDGEPRPLAGAKVGALPRGLRHLKLAREILVETHAVTAEDGTYVLHGVPHGSADVLAMADGHVPGRGPIVRLAEAGTAVASDFTLERGSMVRGRVHDSRGTPVQGARVLWNVVDVRQIEGQPSLAPLFLAGMREFSFPVTDAEGRFVAGPFAGRAPHSLRVTATGFETARHDWEPSAGGARVDGLLEPEALDEVIIELHRGGGIEGTVVEASTGAPVTSFTVSVSGRIEGNPAAPSRWNPFSSGVEVEDPEGRFRIDSVAAGKQKISIHAEGFLEGRAGVHVAEDELVQGIVVQMKRGSTVRGAVVDQEGTPVAGAQVTTEALVQRVFERLENNQRDVEDDLAVRGVRRRGGTPPVGLLRYTAALGLMGTSVTTSEQDGTFELSGLEAGSQEILAFHRSYRTATLALDLVEGEENDPVTVVMSEGGGLKGRVRDRFGLPVVDATVLAVSPGMAGGPSSNGDFHQARTAGDGSYEMLHMEGGPYFLLAARGDENLALTSFLGTINFSLVSVPADRVVTHDLVDTSASACRVHGRVLRDGASVNSGVLLALNLDAEGFLGVDFKAAPIENDGSYEFEGLAPGEYQVTFEGRGGGGGFLLDVPDAPELRFDVQLPDGTVRGRLVDSVTGAPITDARVQLSPLDRLEGPGILAQLLAGEAGVERASVSNEGTFRFKRLAEGGYRLSVERARRRSGDRRIEYAPMLPLHVDVGREQDVDVGDIQLDPGVIVEGIVRDESGLPVADAEILATVRTARRVLPRRARSDDEGRYSIEGLGPGGWQLTASAEDFASGAPRSVEIEKGDERHPEEVELTLVKGVQVTVLVVDAGGEPRAGVACALRREGESGVGAAGNPGDFLQRFFSGGATTGANGKLDLGRRAEGRYELRATQGMQSAKRTFDLPPSGSETLRITLP